MFCEHFFFFADAPLIRASRDNLRCLYIHIFRTWTGSAIKEDQSEERNQTSANFNLKGFFFFLRNPRLFINERRSLWDLRWLINRRGSINVDFWPLPDNWHDRHLVRIVGHLVQIVRSPSCIGLRREKLGLIHVLSFPLSTALAKILMRNYWNAIGQCWPYFTEEQLSVNWNINELIVDTYWIWPQKIYWSFIGEEGVE